MNFQLWPCGLLSWLLIGGLSGYLIGVLLACVALRCYADDAVSACLYSHLDQLILLPASGLRSGAWDFFLPASPAGTHTHASIAVINCLITVYFYLRGILAMKGR